MMPEGEAGQRRDRSSGSRTSWPLITPVVLLFLAAAYLALVWVRPIDGDEGIYLGTYFEITRGRHLYLDFCYFQLPTLPYLSALWVHFVSGPSPAGIRLLSLCWTAGTFLLLFHWCRTRRLAPRVTLCLLLLFGVSAHSVSWLVTIKTYAPSMFLSVAGFVFVCQGEQDEWRLRRFPLFGGLLLGLCVTTRLLYIGCLPVALLWIYLGARRRGSPWPAVLWFVAGTAIAALPALWFAVLDLDAFWFNNVTIHVLRNRVNEAFGDWKQKAQIVVALLEHGQLLLLLLGLAVSARLGLLRRGRDRQELLALLFAGALGFMSLLPTPTFTQYFVTLIPFLVIALRPLAEHLDARASSSRRVAAGTIAALALYLVALPWDAWVMEIRPMAGGWGPYTVRDWNRVSRALEVRTAPDAPVLSWWPGLAIVANRRNVDGMENNFAYLFSDKMTDEQKRRFHVADAAALKEMIRLGQPGAVVLRRRFFLPDASLYRDVVEQRYRLTDVLDDDFEIYVRKHDDDDR